MIFQTLYLYANLISVLKSPAVWNMVDALHNTNYMMYRGASQQPSPTMPSLCYAMPGRPLCSVVRRSGTHILINISFIYRGQRNEHFINTCCSSMRNHKSHGIFFTSLPRKLIRWHRSGYFIPFNKSPTVSVDFLINDARLTWIYDVNTRPGHGEIALLGQSNQEIGS